MTARLTINYEKKPCYDIVFSDSFTLLWEELEKINFFSKFMGVIIKDGTDLYNGFGIAFHNVYHIYKGI